MTNSNKFRRLIWIGIILGGCFGLVSGMTNRPRFASSDLPLTKADYHEELWKPSVIGLPSYIVQKVPLYRFGVTKYRGGLYVLDSSGKLNTFSTFVGGALGGLLAILVGRLSPRDKKIENDAAAQTENIEPAAGPNEDQPLARLLLVGHH